MKIRLLIFAIISIAFFSINTTSAKIPLPLEYRFAMVEFNDSIFVLETEVTVASWLSFYSWVLDNTSVEVAQEVLPDSTLVTKGVWDIFKNKQKTFNNSRTQSGFPLGYFKGTCDTQSNSLNTNNKCPFYNYPITGISYEQAMFFCKWQTNFRGNGFISYRLPTEKEWKTIAKSSTTKKQIPNPLNNKGNLNFNYNCGDDKKQNFICRVANFAQQGSFFDLFGNVSEMTLEKNVSKGGNYQYSFQNCHIDSIQIYKKPQVWLGFRYIGVVNQTKSIKNL